MTKAKTKGRPALIAKEDVISCALELGFHHASMHGVAKKLGVSATALYRHFDSKEALIAACCDHIIAQVNVATSSNWQSYLYRFSESFKQALIAKPNSVDFIRHHQQFTPASNRLVDEALGILIDDGFKPAVAFMAFSTVYRKVTDLVQYQEQYLKALDLKSQSEQQNQDLPSINSEQLPNLAKLFSEVEPLNLEQYFTDSIKIVVEGINAVYCQSK